MSAETFTLRAAAFMAALKKALVCVQKKPILPILGAVLIERIGGQLFITATNAKSAMRVPMVGDNVLPGAACCLPGKELLDSLKAFKFKKDAELIFGLDEGRFSVRVGRRVFTLNTFPADEYPASRDGQPVTSFSVSAAQMAEALGKTAHAMAVQDVRSYLNGMLFEVAADRVALVATDGKRLAECALSVSVFGTPADYIIPESAVKIIQALLKPKLSREGAVSVTFLRDESELTFCRFTMADGTELETNLIDGTFPNYRQVIPEKTEVVVRLDRAELLESVAAMQTVAKEHRNNLLKLSLAAGANAIHLASSNATLSCDEDLSAEISGEADFTIGLNAAYVQDCLENLGSEDVLIKMIDPDVSVTFSGGKNGPTYVVSPIRI